MEIITSLQQLHNYAAQGQGCALALGTFDGLHLGHQEVILAAKQFAETLGLKLAVFTFSNHPMQYINPERIPPMLLTLEDKLKVLEGLGVELLLDLPFDEELANLSPEAFLDTLSPLSCQAIAVGENFTYGYRGLGNSLSLEQAAAERGFRLRVCPLVKWGDVVISSTLIRHLLVEGEVAAAAARLGRNYMLRGRVAHGNERGRLLDFPTANIELPELRQKVRMTIPAGGVYAVKALVRGKTYSGMANIGKNPTYGDVEDLRLETHIFAFQENIYGEELKVEFVERLRGEIKFADVQQLQEQLTKDKAACRKIFNLD